jgi:rubrerythrin
MALEREKLGALLYEAYETEQGGVKLYEAAIEVAQNPNLKKEWKKYLEETMRHVQIVEDLLKTFDFDPSAEPPGRLIVRNLGDAFLDAIESAAEGDDQDAAECVAGECLVFAETKDHLNWKLLKECAKHLTGGEKKALETAASAVEDQEDEHLYHSAGWTRELHFKVLGIPAEFPPAEEKKHVHSAIGAAKAEKARNPARR